MNMRTNLQKYIKRALTSDYNIDYCIVHYFMVHYYIVHYCIVHQYVLTGSITAPSLNHIGRAGGLESGMEHFNTCKRDVESTRFVSVTASTGVRSDIECVGYVYLLISNLALTSF